jgi:hypothetical protein
MLNVPHLQSAYILPCCMQCAPPLANMVAIAQPLTHATAAGQGSVDLNARTQVSAMKSPTCHDAKQNTKKPDMTCTCEVVVPYQ